MIYFHIDNAASRPDAHVLFLLAAFSTSFIIRTPIRGSIHFPGRGPRRVPRVFIRKGIMKSRKIESVAEESGGLLEEDTRRPPGRVRRLVAAPVPIVDFRDPRAVGLGRYLRATRLNRELSCDEVSRRAGVDRVTVIALELGLLRPEQIRSAWLTRLGYALGEDGDDLGLLLGIPLPTSSPQQADIAPYAYLAAKGEMASSEEAAHPTTRPYLGVGLVNSRDRFRGTRPPRDPERLFFDK
jgi:hypothetical protein